jgi:hypothetical protein
MAEAAVMVPVAIQSVFGLRGFGRVYTNSAAYKV